ncbi:hypothetical protein EJD97_013304 [Solanum chilense]|uniref:Uncharacterized protein n=1 Tax=Solanum chilense TaxID=4083 RepID=A0A6N2AHR2_SOLCI|nr:hypothetical protein EJD97_013304 [Solanum chilense]
MSFLAKALHNPSFVEQIMQQNDKRKQLEEAMKKKRRRRPIDYYEAGPSNIIKLEPQDHDIINNEFDDDLQVAMNMSHGNTLINLEEENNEGFWEDMLNENSNVEDEIMALLGVNNEQEDEQLHVDIFSD